MTTAAQNPNVEPEVNPLFRVEYDAILDKWQDGSMPFSTAFDQMTELKKREEEAGNYLHQGVIENGIGIMLGYRSNYTAAIRQFEAARECYEKAGAESRVISTTLNLAETYRLRGNLTRARDMFHQVYRAALEQENLSVQAIAMANEGQIWLSLRNLDKARVTLLKALDIASKPFEEDETEKRYLDRLDHICEVEYALASTFMFAGNIEQAWEHAKKSYALAEKLKRPLRQGFANRALGTVVTEMDEVHDEEFGADPDEYFKRALKAFREVKAEGEVAHTLFSHGKSLAKRGKRRNAATVFQQAMIIFTKLGMTEDAARAAEAQLDVL